MNVFCWQEDSRDVEGADADDREPFREVPCHCSGTRTRPMEKGARGTEVLAQTNVHVMFQRAE